MLLTLEIRFWIILSIALICYVMYLFFVKHQKVILKPINKVKKIKNTKRRIKRAKAWDFIPIEQDYQDYDILPPKIKISEAKNIDSDLDTNIQNPYQDTTNHDNKLDINPSINISWDDNKVSQDDFDKDVSQLDKPNIELNQLNIKNLDHSQIESKNEVQDWQDTLLDPELIENNLQQEDVKELQKPEIIWSKTQENSQNLNLENVSKLNEVSLQQDLNNSTSQDQEKQKQIKDLEVKRLQKQISTKLVAIRYEALAFKETWNLESYERKLIEWLSIDNENQEFIEMLWSLYFYEEKYNKALALLKRAFDKNPQSHNVLWQLGYIYQRKWDFDKAQDYYQRAIFLKPDNTKYLMSLVDLSYENKNYEQALDYSLQALELKPTNITYVLAVAAIYDAIWDTPRAQDFYTYAYNLDPNHPIVQKKLLRDL